MPEKNFQNGGRVSNEFDKAVKFSLTKLACEQVLLFGRAKRVSLERARLGQIGQLARRLEQNIVISIAKYKINNLWLLLFYDAKFKASASLNLVAIERAESSNNQRTSLAFSSERIQRILLRKLNILLSDPETIPVFP